jgi:nucleotide-binding universal stress UspA family protein
MSAPTVAFQRCLVGVDFDEALEPLLRYLEYFLSKVHCQRLQLAHVHRELPVFGMADLLPDVRTEADQETERKIRDLSDTLMPHFPATATEVAVLHGNPLEMLLGAAADMAANLLVIGKKSTDAHHGILARNLVRQSSMLALVVPHQAKPSLRKILVPVDFSPNGIAAFHAALSLAGQLAERPQIDIIHAYEVPGSFGTFRFNQERVIQLLEDDRVAALDQFIDENVPADWRQHIGKVLLKHTHYSVGEQLSVFAHRHAYDLIVMGAKGHSKVSRLLLGSVTEKILAATSEVPVLIIR